MNRSNRANHRGDKRAEDRLGRGGSTAPYIAARLGFRNYWYPALFSRELADDRPAGVRLLGENILLRRVEGKVFGVHDQCLHRGVRFSRKPECYTSDTITCWYHGFTYSMRDGKLTEILTEPGSSLRGKLALKTYPVAEAKGIIFVFIGDNEPPELARDVAPGFLDDDLAVNGIRDEVKTNWRVGAENGFDTTHIYIHRNSDLIAGNRIILPLGLVPNDRQSIATFTDNEPYGVLDSMFENYQPVFQSQIGEQVVVESSGAANEKIIAREISIWMPGALKVDPFPDPEIIQFEWYVPVEVNSHMYWRVLGKKACNSAEAGAFAEEFRTRWEPLALHGFNDADIWAREGMQEFYRDDSAWEREHLFKPDRCLVEWRKLASRLNRGIQPEP